MPHNTPFPDEILLNIAAYLDHVTLLQFAKAHPTLRTIAFDVLSKGNTPSERALHLLKRNFILALAADDFSSFKMRSLEVLNTYRSLKTSAPLAPSFIALTAAICLRTDVFATDEAKRHEALNDILLASLDSTAQGNCRCDGKTRSHPKEGDR